MYTTPRILLKIAHALACKIFAILLGVLAPLASGSGPEELQLEILPVVDGRLLPRSDYRLEDSFGTPFSVTRLDYLLSGLQFQSKEGNWYAFRNWNAFFSLEKGKNSASISPAPVGEFTAIRFNVGVAPDINSSDPHQFPDSHPLNPQVNGLHWGWQGGYVFLAIEGHFKKGQSVNSLGGYSYHIANDPNLMTVTLPVEFDSSKHSRITLELNVDSIVAGSDCINIVDTPSTHSREEDPLAAKLTSNIETAFEVREIGSVRYQEGQATYHPAASNANTAATPYLTRVTERFPKVRFPEDNPLTEEGVALGEMLFKDSRLSRGDQQSCLSCHSPEFAFSDQAPFSVGVEGKVGTRNAMPLFNLAWSSHFFWDGRASSLREQALMPIQDPLEMNESLERVVEKLEADPDYPERFQAAFGTKEITTDRIGLSLEQFLLTQFAQDSKFDRAARGEAAFTPEEKRGLALFVTEYDPSKNLLGADCFHCHGGNLFTNNRFANNGLDSEFKDLGRYLVTRDKADEGLFKVPSLRNAELTAPYMHDGRFATLEEVVDHYSEGVKPSSTLDPNLAKHPSSGLRLSEEDKQALVAFLKTLTETSLLNDSPAALAKN